MPRSIQRGASIRRSIQILAPPEKVFAAFTTDAAVGTWYMDGATIELRVGGKLTFEGMEGNVVADITEVTEGERVVLEYQAPWWGTVSWDLKPSEKGTRVTLVHVGFEGREEWVTRFTWGWESFLKALKAYVEGRPIR